MKGIFRSGRLEVLHNKSVLKSFAKLTGKYLCWGLYFNKFAGQRPAILLKRDSDTVFSCEFCRIFKNTLTRDCFWIFLLKFSETRNITRYWKDYSGDSGRLVLRKYKKIYLENKDVFSTLRNISDGIFPENNLIIDFWQDLKYTSGNLGKPVRRLFCLIIIFIMSFPEFSWGVINQNAFLDGFFQKVCDTIGFLHR